MEKESMPLLVQKIAIKTPQPIGWGVGYALFNYSRVEKCLMVRTI